MHNPPRLTMQFVAASRSGSMTTSQHAACCMPNRPPEMKSSRSGQLALGLSCPGTESGYRWVTLTSWSQSHHSIHAAARRQPRLTMPQHTSMTRLLLNYVQSLEHEKRLIQGLPLEELDALQARRHAAATTIQAHWRGAQQRQQLRLTIPAMVSCCLAMDAVYGCSAPDSVRGAPNNSRTRKATSCLLCWWFCSRPWC